LCVCLGVALAASDCWGSAFVRGGYYRLGDDDPGAAPGALGNPITRDSLGDDEPLSRYGLPHYASDVPPRGPSDNKLSMMFVNDEQLLGPFPGAYGRTQSLPMIEQGYALEAWAKAAPSLRVAQRNGLVAYNGDPQSANGFGFFQHAENYVLRAGDFERVLGPATDGQWHHLAYVQSLGTSSYYYDGQLVGETNKDPLPAAANGGFHLAGLLKGQLIDTPPFPFDGWIDEVRYQTFNPIAAGAFNPTAFLIGPPVPEPVAAPLLACAALLALRRRRRRWTVER
jgi:hypothetical protein